MLNQSLKDQIVRRLVEGVQTPGQYIGGELNAVVRDHGSVVRCVVTDSVTETTDRISTQSVRDWSDLGSLVLRAARRAAATHLVESAEQAGRGYPPASICRRLGERA